MKVVLNMDEVREAIVQWLERRGINAETSDLEFNNQAGYHTTFDTVIENVVLPPKDGPYR